MSPTNNTFLSSPGLSWLSACQQLEQQGEAYCIATVVACVGSVPRASGAKMVITRHSQFDTLGGGNLEYQVIAKARDSLSKQHGELLIERFTLAADLGQCCGGAVQVMFEFFHNCTPQVVIFGAGHVCQALTSVLAELPCHVKVIDSRSEWLEPLQKKGIDTKLAPAPSECVATLRDKAYVLIMTQDHALDYDLTLRALEQQRFAYVGLIGSQGKRQRFEFRLKENLSQPQLIDQLTCPIGHPDVQGKLPMQVAVSVAAQLIQQFEQHTTAEPTGDTQWKQVNNARQQLKEKHE